MSLSEIVPDDTLKPKLLRLLLREYIPDEKHPCDNLSIFTHVVSTVKTHRLLSEQVPTGTKVEFIDTWKLAVDLWIKRLLSLASSPLLDNTCAGICLLGLTCQECCEERFLESYPLWLNHLLSLLQTPGVPYFLMEASCASISDLLTRLSGLSNAKKDGHSQATRVIQPLLKLLNSDVSTILLEQALSLLCVLVIFFPSSVHQHYESVESTIMLKIMSGECSAIVIGKLGHALSVLPKSKRDENSCFQLMEKILVFINCQLNEAFQGLQEDERITKAIRALLPSDKDPMKLLWGSTESDQSAFLTRWPERLLGSRISSLMQCCCNMLRNFMVPLPLSGLIALVERVLMFDGVSCPSPNSLMTMLKPELIFSEIPHLQLHSLEILKSLIEGLGKIQLLRCAPAIVQLLNRYLMRCKLPDLKTKAYSALKTLVNSVGAGMACHISHDIISNIFVDLEFTHNSKYSVNQSNVSEVNSGSSHQKKRKLSSIAEQPCGLEAEISYHSTTVCVKLAAVETLEAFLTVAGSMIHKNNRDVDNLLITASKNARKAGFAELHLASLRAFLASLITSGRKHSTLLSVAQGTFREGMRPEGTKLSEFCRHALHVLELSTVPFANPQPHSDEFRTSNKKLNSASSNENEHISIVEQLGYNELQLDDELNTDWLQNEEETESPPTETQENIPNTEKPPASSTGISNGSSTPECRMLETVNEPNPERKAIVDHGDASSVLVNQLADERTSFDTVLLHSEATTGNVMIPENKDVVCVSDENDLGTKKTDLATIYEKMAATLPDLDEYLSDDQIPDIVDGDPDSDD